MWTAWMGRIRVGFAAVVVASCVAKVGSGQGLPGTEGGLGQQIAALVSDPAVARAHWGVMVAGMDGTPIFSLNEGQFFQPASNTKLFTTAAALALLGPERRFTSRIEGPPGNQGESTLRGDLVLYGSGDANLSGRAVPYVDPAERPKGESAGPDPLRYLEQMADGVAGTGVKRVTGDVVGDDTLFPWEPYGVDWAIDDAVWGYGAPVSALSINDNQIRVTVTPGPRAGDAATVALDPAVAYYTVDASGLTTGAAHSGSHVGMARAMGSKVLRVYGVMAVDAGSDVEEVAIEDPAEYAAVALKGMLEERGIVVTGTARAQHRMPMGTVGFQKEAGEALPSLPKTAVGAVSKLLTGQTTCFDACPMSVEHTSPTLAEDVGVTNKLSLNLHAELLLHQLGRTFGNDGSAAQGARVVRQFLVDAGVDPQDFVFYDGSGMSGHDLVTPRAVARLLEYAAGQPWFGVYKASLPVGGVDGSLINRFAGAPLDLLKGRVFAKTGTLGEARALSGYLECASGRMVVFSIMVTDHAPGTSGDRAAMDKIVAAVAAAE
jgi:serine-type D-Ala-D-Ala carboxypeptidase/endopeptidase (penicillin-binding protein 4)